MHLFKENELELARAIGSLNYTNPFTPQRLEQEQRILGTQATTDSPVWHKIYNKGSVTPNVEKIFALCREFVSDLRGRFDVSGFKHASDDEMEAYDELVVYWLFEKYRLTMGEMMVSHPDETFFPCYRDFANDFDEFISKVPRRCPSLFSPEKTFAIYFQIHRVSSATSHSAEDITLVFYDFRITGHFFTQNLGNLPNRLVTLPFLWQTYNHRYLVVHRR